MNVKYDKSISFKPKKYAFKLENSERILEYLENFIKNSSTKNVNGYGTIGLAKNTIRTYKSLYRILKSFENDTNRHFFIHSFDKMNSEDFTRYLKIEKNYSDNYCGQILKLLKIILRDAEKSGLDVHPYCNYISSFKQKPSERIIHTLNPDEIKSLKNLKNISKNLKDTYNWFLIGLSIGQRISDVLSLKPENIRIEPNGLYVDIIQRKTKTPVTIGVADPMTINIILNDFPKAVSQVMFNKQIKTICKNAGIDNLVKGFKNNPIRRRKEIVSAPKYEFVTSHITRRSFATNYFGKIETPLLMNITGHTKESTFLTYIGTVQNKDALADLFIQQSNIIW